MTVFHAPHPDEPYGIPDRPSVRGSFDELKNVPDLDMMDAWKYRSVEMGG